MSITYKVNDVSDCGSVNDVLESIGANEDYTFSRVADFPSYRWLFNGQGEPVCIINKSYMKKSFMQPIKAFSYVDAIADGLGMSYDKAGFKNGGRHMFVSLRKKNSIVIDAEVGDTMDEIVQFWTSFDGSITHIVSKMIERLVCSNGMVALDTQSRSKVKHSGLQEMKLEQLVDQITGIQNVFLDTKSAIETLAETRVTTTQAKEVISDLFVGDSKRMENIRDDIFNRFRTGRGNSGKTAWDLMNGITEWQNYGKSYRSTINSPEENRLHSLSLGDEASRSKKLWKRVMALAN